MMPYLFPNALAKQIEGELKTAEATNRPEAAANWLLNRFERVPEMVSTEIDGDLVEALLLPLALVRVAMALVGYTQFLDKHAYLDFGDESANLNRFEHVLRNKKESLLMRKGKLTEPHLFVIFRNHVFDGVYCGIPSEVGITY